jgi:hypothetical protein
MHALSAADIVRAWEAGRDKHPVDKALLLLALAFPELSPTELSTLTVGQRNTRLLALRQKTLGTIARCFVACPRCNEQLEFTLDTQAMLPAESPALTGPAEQVNTLNVDDFSLSFRVPTSLDLAAVTHCVDVHTGRLLLIKRCVVQATHQDQTVAVENLPENVLQVLAEAIIEHDPLAEMEFALDCSACKCTWTTLFDIVSFFWTELEAMAKRLLRDVHTIASAYGWRESDILALSATRRQFYLELIH